MSQAILPVLTVISPNVVTKQLVDIKERDVQHKAVRFSKTSNKCLILTPGENADLNFLGGKPVPFPYPPPQPNEPTKTLRSLINIRRDSLHFVAAATNVVLAAPEDDDLDVSDVVDGRVSGDEDKQEELPQVEDPRKLKRYNIQVTTS